MREYTKYALQEIIGWKEFEDICTDYLYSEHSYRNIRQAGRTSDGGRDSVVLLHDNIDDIIFAFSTEKDPVGGDSSKFFREYNRWKNAYINKFIFISNQDLGAKKIDLQKKLLKPPVVIYDITDLVRFLDLTPVGEKIRKKYGIYLDSGQDLKLKANSSGIIKLIKSSRISLTSDYNARISVPGTDIDYDVDLQMEERTVSSITVSNKKQNIPIKFEFKMDIDKNNKISNQGRFNIHAELKGFDVKQGLKFHKFIRNAKRMRIITVKSLIVNKNLFIAHFDDSNSQTIPAKILSLLDKLSFIQELSETRIPLPTQISIEDAVSIEDVYNYLRNRKIEHIYQSFILKPKLAKEYASTILDLSKDGIIENMSIINKNDFRTVCGIKISLGPTKTFYPKMKVKKPLDALRSEIIESTDDDIEVELEPVDDSSILVRPWKQASKDLAID